MSIWALAIAAAIDAVPVPTGVQSAAVADAAHTGRLLYDYDLAGWVSTDALLAALPDPGKAGVRGWIVEGEDADQLAVYYGKRGATPFKIFIAHIHNGNVTSSALVKPGDGDRMTNIERRMVEARDVVLNPSAMAAANVGACAREPFNTVVLPPTTERDIVRVYLLTPQPASHAIPFGGHYRFDVDAQNRVASSRAFAKSCAQIAQPTNPPGQPAAVFITHLLDDQPTEIHVWQSLVIKQPVYVGIMSNNQIWQVTGEAVKIVGLAPKR